MGATLLLQYGWANAAWAIVATGLIIFLAGLPISIYAARYGVDMRPADPRRRLRLPGLEP